MHTGETNLHRAVGSRWWEKKRVTYVRRTKESEMEVDPTDNNHVRVWNDDGPHTLTSRRAEESIPTTYVCNCKIIMPKYVNQVAAGTLLFLMGVQVHHLDDSMTYITSLKDGFAFDPNVIIASNSRRTTEGTSDDNDVTELVAAVNKASFQLAFDQSYGFFDDIPEEIWKDQQQWATQQNHDHRYVVGRHYNKPALWYYNNYNPFFSCPQVKRIAGVGDGPKWVCDPHRLVRQAERRKAAGLPEPHCIIYSVGSNGNYEFEDGMYKRIHHGICETHIFDFSNDYTRPENKERNMHFHRWGLQGSQQDRGKRFLSYQQILERYGHENRTIGTCLRLRACVC